MEYSRFFVFVRGRNHIVLIIAAMIKFPQTLRLRDFLEKNLTFGCLLWYFKEILLTLMLLIFVIDISTMKAKVNIFCLPVLVVRVVHHHLCILTRG